MNGNHNNLRSYFLLDPKVAFLNHGSFGACPKPVFERFQAWQLELERQPVEFLGRRSDGLMDDARAKLGEYVNASADELIFVPNATAGINIVARSLDLKPGDEILSNDHEYGALDFTWGFVCSKTGAKYVQHSIPLPVTTHEDFVESLWEKVTPHTRVIYMSHVTSPTALITPVAEICRRAREAGIWTVIDGAHAPGHIPVDLHTIGADFYSGNCHKWMSAPKGTAFLFACPEHQNLLNPLIVSWGFDDPTWAGRNLWQGTREVSAFLSVPDAINFMAEHDWDNVRRQCHALAVETRQRIIDLTGLPAITPEDQGWFNQMFTARLPKCDDEVLKARLYDEYLVEVPLVKRGDENFIRVSVQGYNTREDMDRLLNALSELLPQMAQ